MKKNLLLRLGALTPVTDSHNLACRQPIPAWHALAVRYAQATPLRPSDLNPSKIFATHSSH